MYTTYNMVNLINITQARNNLSKIIDQVVTEKKTVILIRESVPQAAILPYDQFQKQEEQWRESLDKIMIEGKKRFKLYLKKKGIPYPKTEEEMYELIDKISGRHWYQYLRLSVFRQ